MNDVTLYRIYIPALEPDGVSMTIDVEARNWMLALRYGLDEIGVDPNLVKQAICDIKPDKTIHVMEPAQGRVFVLRELPESNESAALAPQRVDTSSVSRRYTPVPRPDDDIPWHDARDAFEEEEELPLAQEIEDPLADVITQEIPRPTADAVIEAANEYPLTEADLEKYFEPAAQRPPRRTISHLDLGSWHPQDAHVISREPSTEIPADLRGPLAASAPASDELLSRVFEEMADIDTASGSVEEALQFALELAVDRIPSEAGWLLLADMNRRDLYVATATGPKAEEVIKYRLPMGRGIAGFCAVNGMSLILSDVEQDPRFQSMISRSVGLRIDSVACSPIQQDDRVFGAIQIMNHLRRAEYTAGELDALNYIARRTAEYLTTHVRF